MWEKELQIAKELAVDAGREIMKIYNQQEIQVEYKQDASPLTLADKASNQVIVSGLRHEFPSYAILSEEEREDTIRLNNELCFVVDPLDGTKEFIKRNGQFTVNIALSFRNKVVMGVIYVPVTKELYYAVRGEGAYCVESDGSVTKLAVSTNKDRESMRVVMSNSHNCLEMERLIKKYNLTNCVSVGSSLKGCIVARGEAEVYYRHNPTMEWDTAAMQCIVEEAGGIFKQMDDTEMTYNRENSLNAKGFYILNCIENKLEN